MIKKTKQPNFDQALSNLRDHSFDVSEQSTVAPEPQLAMSGDTAIGSTGRSRDVAAEPRRGSAAIRPAVPGPLPGVMVRKNGCAAFLVRLPDGYAALTAQPGVLLGGEIARLVDRGYQKFFKTSRLEVPATAAQLKAVHDFTEQLKLATGSVSLYNESLGTVSDRYLYDRVKGRDLPESERPVRPWDRPEGAP
ncbi:MAG TPA: hypothetical protein VGD59_10710 [Acidisarcina sp.]